MFSLLAVPRQCNASGITLLVHSRKTAVLICVLQCKLLCTLAEMRPGEEKELLLVLA